MRGMSHGWSTGCKAVMETIKQSDKSMPVRTRPMCNY